MYRHVTSHREPESARKAISSGFLSIPHCTQEGTKVELLNELYDDIQLEKQLLGDRAHRTIRDIDMQIHSLKKKKKLKLVEKLRKRVENLWEPLKELQVL